MGQGQLPESSVRAQELFKRGLQESALDRWSAALALFRKSYALVPRASTAFNVAMVYVKLKRPADAARAFRQYLAFDETQTSADRRQAARIALERAETELARLIVEVSPAHATIRINGAEDGLHTIQRSYEINPGELRLHISAPDYESQTMERELAEGDQVALSVALKYQPHPMSNQQRIAAEAPAADHGKSDPSFIESSWFWATVGIVAVGAATGIAFGLAMSGTDEPYSGNTGVVLETLK